MLALSAAWARFPTSSFRDISWTCDLPVFSPGLGLGTPIIPMTVCPAGQRGITRPEGRFLPRLGASDRRGNHPEAPGVSPVRGTTGHRRVRDTGHVDGAGGAASHVHTAGIFGQCVRWYGA